MAFDKSISLPLDKCISVIVDKGVVTSRLSVLLCGREKECTLSCDDPLGRVKFTIIHILGLGRLPLILFLPCTSKYVHGLGRGLDVNLTTISYVGFDARDGMAVVTEQDGEERGCERLESPPWFFTQAREKRSFLSTTGMNTVPFPPATLNCGCFQ